MIRKLATADIDTVSNIWLDTNINAHHFISQRYWIDHFDAVKQMLAQAEVYVYINEENKIEGFIGLQEDYIEGIFVSNLAQSKGIGKKLLNFVKNTRKQLKLFVYQKTARAIKFYQRENFKIEYENIDENTGEKEYSMIWKQ